MKFQDRRKFLSLAVSIGGAAALGGGAAWLRTQKTDRMRASFVGILREQAEQIATMISMAVREIESQIGWTTQLSWTAGTIDQRLLDDQRLLRQVPAITEVSQLDAAGIERLRVSRFATDVVASGADYSKDVKFTEAMAKKVYYGPVYFRESGPVNSRISDPYMTLAAAGTRRDAGVTIVEVNLRLIILPAMTGMTVGPHDVGYVLDAQNQVIMHPNSNLVRRDLAALAQVKAARASGYYDVATEPMQLVPDIDGREVFAASAAVSPLGWLVFVEVPAEHANTEMSARVNPYRILLRKAEATAAIIDRHFQEIESQVGWTTHLPWSADTINQRRFDGLRLLRQAPVIAELAQLDPAGKEQLRVSRLALDLGQEHNDYSHDPKFTEAVANKTYYGPVYFRRQSEAYVTLALAGTRRDAGVSVAEFDPKLVWDLITAVKVGEHGLAYAIDAQGRLISHPDLSLVLRNTDMTQLAQVRAARAAVSGGAGEPVHEAKDIRGRDVLTAYAPVARLCWLVFVELPIEEANALAR